MSPTLQHKESGRLKLLFKGAGDAESQHAAIFVVPGVGTLEPACWKPSDGDNWLRALSSDWSRPVAIYSFEHGLSRVSDLTWNDVKGAGSLLFQELCRFVEEQQSSECPFIYVAHSLGGIILKRALSLAYDQERRSGLLENAAAALFFSTPHSRLQSVLAQQISEIFRFYANSKQRTSSVLEEICTHASQDCITFEDTFNRHRAARVLSFYEEEGMRTKKFSLSKTTLVDENSARTNAPGETLLGLGADHSRICCLQVDPEIFTQTLHHIWSAIVNTQVRIHGRMQLVNFQRPSFVTTSTDWTGSSECLRSMTPDNIERQSSKTLNYWLKLIFFQVRTVIELRPNSKICPYTLRDKKRRSTDSSPNGRPSSTHKQDARLPCFSIPYERNDGFFERDVVLKTIEETLRPSESSLASTAHWSAATRSIALFGIGGIGKTQVAVEYAYRAQQKQTYDAILWVNAQSSERIVQSFMDIALNLGLIVQNSIEAKDRIVARDLVLGWLSKPIKNLSQSEDRTPEEATWLLVFDNVDHFELLDDFWPGNSCGSILLTSRDPIAYYESYSTTIGLQLPLFKRWETEEFLLKMTKRSRQEEAESALSATAETLGGIPMAIAQMAGQINRRQINLTEFVTSYNDTRSRRALFSTAPKDRRTRYEHTIASVWGFNDLKHGSQLLDVLSFFEPSSIPEELVQNNPAIVDMELYPHSQAVYEDARTELLSSSLVTRNRNTKTLAIHRLMSDALRSQMTSERYTLALITALQLISGVWPYKDGAAFANEKYRWVKSFELWPHILCLCGHTDDEKWLPPVKISKEHLEPSKVLLEATWYSIMTANFGNTMRFLNAAKKIWSAQQQDKLRVEHRDQYVKEQFEEQTRLIELYPGVLSLHTNSPEMALVHCKKYKSMLEEKMRSDSQGRLGHDARLAIAWNELGNAYLHNNEAKKAEKYFLMSISAHRDSPEMDQGNMPLSNLGFALWMQGRLEDAIKTFRDALKDRAARYGRDDNVSFSTGKLLLGLGNVLYEQGSYDESFNFHKRSKKQYESTVGKHHHRTGDACVHIADHHFRLQQYPLAKAYLDQAARIYGAQDHFKPERARVCYKQWHVFKALAEEDAAVESAAEALRLYRATYPCDERDLEDLSHDDFTRPIVFWSK
ncbi:hypothetical protein AC578_6784 [Pseudocercospora eumusae]|uniref:NB-ARC domain-containing protein n=1 Tax=Pseudocercospora eumusae TaxID=321146 RepID=A0A139GVX6_9PEZI|nr:hypothetical protein AC578_6784 [Pseudocercospora eumusae]